MRCEEARAALAGAGYGQAPPELEAHVADCAACRALRAQHAALDRVLALDAKKVEVSPGFDARFFERLEQEKRRSRPRRLRRLVFFAAPLLAAAAAAALVLRPREEPPPPMPGDDLALAMDLELVEDMDVVERLDEIEAYELLGQVDEAELERLAAPEPQ